jgi:peptide/nickel transport system ATP-binding protein
MTRDDTASFTIEGLTISYRGRPNAHRVVNDVSLRLERGEILGLAGESGCGKSTTALGCTGFPLPGMATRSGRALLGDTDLLTQPMRTLRRYWGRNIAYLPQDATTSLTPDRKVGVQFSEILRRHLDLNGHAATTRAIEMLERVGLPDASDALERYPFQFSGGQQQRLALAMALVCRPRVLILDEPTTGLDATTQKVITGLIEDLVSSLETAALYVSHDLSLLCSIAQRVAIMYAGEIVEVATAAEIWANPAHPYAAALVDAVPSVDTDEEVTAIPGRPPHGVVLGRCSFAPRCPHVVSRCTGGDVPLQSVAGRLVRCVRAGELGMLRRTRPLRPIRDRDGESEPLFETTGLTCRYSTTRGPTRAVVEDVTFTVETGEILGIVGESGSGKSTLLRTLVGLHSNATGTLRYQGTPLPIPVARRHAAARREIQIVFQNPATSLNPRHTVDRILERPLDVFFPRVNNETRRARIRELLDAVQLDAGLLHRYPRELSGGQQQRVALARAFASRPSIVLCDEVVSALDVSVQAAILQLVRRLRDESGTAFVFVTHDLAVVRSIADRIIVMKSGQIVETADTLPLFQDPTAPYTRELITAARKTPGS